MTILADWLARAPFGLAMSSGFFSFYAHTGMLAALRARGLAPAHVAGSSAGALVAGAWAAGCEPERLAAVLSSLRRADFWDPALGAGVLAGRKFGALLRDVLPVTTFRECRVPVRISVFDILRRATRVVDDGDLATAILASCAVPAMFHPVRVDGRPCWDGGILDRPGIAGVPPGRLLLHHIAAPPPWGYAVVQPPRRRDMVSLVIDELPRANPFKLDAGRAAMRAARIATDHALDRPIAADVVRVRATR